MGHLGQIENAWRAWRYGRPSGISSQADYIAKPGAVWSRAEPADTRRRTAPRRLGRIEIDFTPLIGPLPELGVFALPQGRALGHAGLAFDSEGQIIRETTWYGGDLSSDHLPRSFGPPQRVQGTCLALISQFADANYGHYVLDCVSRLGVAERAGWSPSKIDRYYLCRPPSVSAHRLLGKLGVPDERCVWSEARTNIVADLLLVTTFPGTRRNYARVVPETISRPFAAQARGGRRLFIPRHGVRKASNTEQIEAIAVEQGLEVYDFQTVEDEFSYFRSAELVVGPHGAGLTNIAVCRPGTKILEIIPTDHVHPYYYTLAEAAGLDYSYLGAKSAEQRAPGSWGPSPHDFYVDPVEFREALLSLTAAP
jgi:hypothetical protein